jgi:hypothetical protein
MKHWFWKFLRDKTSNFAPLDKVFTKIRVDTPNCGTAV